MSIAKEVLSLCEYFMDKEGRSVVHGDYKFKLPYGNKHDVLFLADTKKLDKSWKRGDPMLHIGSGGEGQLHNRYNDFQDWLKTNKDIEVAQVSHTPQDMISKNHPGHIGFVNGRHRFAVLRDMGLKKIPVAVPKGQQGLFKQRFG